MKLLLTCILLVLLLHSFTFFRLCFLSMYVWFYSCLLMQFMCFYCYDYVFLLYVYVWLPWLRFFRAFPQLWGKCQGKIRKDGAGPALFLIFVFSMYFLCCSVYCLFCDVLCILCVCICPLTYCQRVAKNLRLNIHSFSSLFYDKSKASSKASSPHSAIQSFLFQMRVSSPFLKVIQ